MLEEERQAAQSDEALAVQAQNGDAEAFALLLERITPLARARVAALAAGSVPGQSREDLFQEGMLGLISAVTAYQPERGAAFRTFASVCVGNRVLSALRRSAGQSEEVPLPEVAFHLEAPESDPQDVFFAMEETRRMMEAIRRNLTSLERGVMEAYLAGDDYGQIAKRLGVGQKTVDNALQRVRRKLRQPGEPPPAAQ
jgi:RNA polymerase sporulation-specific sigma factor